jgi:hypothetical protein
MTVLLLSLANAADCKSAEPRAEHPVERVFTDALTNTINVRMRVNRLKDPLVPPNPLHWMFGGFAIHRRMSI